MRNMVLGMSCVENQLLGFLSQKNMDCARAIAFENSFIPLKDIYKSVMDGGNFVSFRGIDRIQDELIKNGFLQMQFLRVSFEKVPIFEALSDWITLIRVNRSFCMRELSAQGLREDHYVRLYSKNNKLFLQNDIPPICVQTSEQKIKDIYEHSAIVFRLELTERINIDKNFRRRRRFVPENSLIVSETDFNVPDMKAEELISKLKDIALIYKITRYRLLIYESCFADVQWMEPIIHEIEAVCGKIEYLSLKKSYRLSDLEECLKRLVNCENETNKTLGKMYGGRK